VPTVLANGIVIDIEHIGGFLEASGSWPSTLAEALEARS
jgi:hypothetical protein